MKIKSIKFKLTTSRVKCNLCKERIVGDEGFVHITCGNDGGTYYLGFNHMRICWKCLMKSLGEFKEDRKDRKKRYLELTKRAIVRNLE